MARPNPNQWDVPSGPADAARRPAEHGLGSRSQLAARRQDRPCPQPQDEGGSRMIRQATMALALIGLLALSGCGSATGNPTKGVTTIEFATQGLGSEGDATKKAVAEFEKANPDIQ